MSQWHHYLVTLECIYVSESFLLSDYSEILHYDDKNILHWYQKSPQQNNAVGCSSRRYRPPPYVNSRYDVDKNMWWVHCISMYILLNVSIKSHGECRISGKNSEGLEMDSIQSIPVYLHREAEFLRDLLVQILDSPAPTFDKNKNNFSGSLRSPYILYRL